MSEAMQGFWEGKNMMAAARKHAKELVVEGKRSEAESALASAHYSRAGTLRTRGRMWLPFVAWHLLRAWKYARKLATRRDITNLSPEQCDIAGTILLKNPISNFSDFKAAMRCLTFGLEKARKGSTAPHTIALLHIGIGECWHYLGNFTQARWSFYDAVNEIPRIERDEPTLHGKRQLVRVLRHCGDYLAHRSDGYDPDAIFTGQELLRRAEKIAREVSSDQLVKMKSAV